MTSERRILIAAACAICLVSSPALAQFGSIFGGQQSPRPPGDIPTGHPSAPPMEPRNFPQYDPREPAPEPPPPPLTRFPQGVPQQQGSAPPPGGYQSQPLPPPPGAAPPQPANAPPPAAAPGQPNPLPGLPPGQRQPRGTPQPANTEPSQQQQNDEVIVAPPAVKIANPTAVFAGLDKITGRIISFDVAIDETVQFGALRLTPRACYTRPPTETANTDGFVEVDEITLKGEVKRIFTGWMFAASPGLHAVEHPIYDVWLTDCKGGAAKVAGAEAQPPETPQAGAPPPAAPAQRAPAPRAAPSSPSLLSPAPTVPQPPPRR